MRPGDGEWSEPGKKQGAGVNWLSPKTVAERLDINRTTAMRMMKDGRLPGFELMPGMWRVSEEALDKMAKRAAKRNGGGQFEKSGKLGRASI